MAVGQTTEVVRELWEEADDVTVSVGDVEVFDGLTMEGVFEFSSSHSCSTRVVRFSALFTLLGGELQSMLKALPRAIAKELILALRGIFP